MREVWRPEKKTCIETKLLFKMCGGRESSRVNRRNPKFNSTSCPSQFRTFQFSSFQFLKIKSYAKGVVLHPPLQKKKKSWESCVYTQGRGVKGASEGESRKRSGTTKNKDVQPASHLTQYHCLSGTTKANLRGDKHACLKLKHPPSRHW